MGIEDESFLNVSKFLVDLSFEIGLKDINWTKVNQYRIAGELEALKRHKVKLAAAIKENIRLLCVHMGAHSSKYSQKELVIIRSMYVQHKDALQKVEGHIAFTVQMMYQIQSQSIKEEKGMGYYDTSV